MILLRLIWLIVFVKTSEIRCYTGKFEIGRDNFTVREAVLPFSNTPIGCITIYQPDTMENCRTNAIIHVGIAPTYDGCHVEDDPSYSPNPSIRCYCSTDMCNHPRYFQKAVKKQIHEIEDPFPRRLLTKCALGYVRNYLDFTEMMKEMVSGTFFNETETGNSTKTSNSAVTHFVVFTVLVLIFNY